MLLYISLILRNCTTEELKSVERKNEELALLNIINKCGSKLNKI